MKEQRARVAKRIEELSGIKPQKYTAMELRGKRPMLSRVQRKEMARYHRAVQEQKVELGKKLKGIDDYFGRVEISRQDKKPQVVIPPIPRMRRTRLERHRKRMGRGY